MISDPMTSDNKPAKFMALPLCTTTEIFGKWDWLIVVTYLPFHVIRPNFYVSGHFFCPPPIIVGVRILFIAISSGRVELNFGFASDIGGAIGVPQGA